ncbi:MAG TPA: GtrA family protein [Patescibacteria group bacterium]|nr:GtrA family protein [Patescibacteria group bacterium]
MVASIKLKIFKFLQHPLGRYLVVGGGVYILELIIIVIAQKVGANPVLAVGISFWLGLLVSFAVQKFVTFGDKRMHRRVLTYQVLAFSLLVLFNFGFTILVTSVLSPQVPAVASRTIALLVTMLWNFYLYKTRLFKNDNATVY